METPNQGYYYYYCPFFKDVFETEADSNNISENIVVSSSLLQGKLEEFSNWQDKEKDMVTSWPQSQPKTKENRIESVDSVEEMQRRFEKVTGKSNTILHVHCIALYNCIHVHVHCIAVYMYMYMYS